MFLTCIEWFVYCNDYFIVLSNKEFTINKFHDCFLFIVELFRPTQVTFENLTTINVKLLSLVECYDKKGSYLGDIFEQNCTLYVKSS